MNEPIPGTNGNVDDVSCPMARAISSLSGKWKPMILHMLSEHDHFFTQIVRNLPGASRKVITDHLRELEKDGLITRTATDEKRVRVRYALSGRGRTLAPVLDQLYAWGAEELAGVPA